VPYDQGASARVNVERADEPGESVRRLEAFPGRDVIAPPLGPRCIVTGDESGKDRRRRETVGPPMLDERLPHVSEHEHL